MRQSRSNCLWPTGRFSSSTDMEPSEWFVFYHQVRNGNGLGNRLFGNPATPLPNDLVPGHAILDLFESNPHHNARALERGLPAANPRVGHNVPAQLDPLARSVAFRLHADALHYPPSGA